jgi:phosphoribosylanthranilate isomerase
MKAVAVSGPDDIAAAEAYYAAADWLLFDAKAPAGATRPGGNAQSFDWSLLKGRKWPLPWMLAGGLTPDNLAEAVRVTKAKAVDVSSSVESAPGVKDPLKIRAFLEAAGRV